MAHQTGENEQALRKIVDFTRMGSLIVMALHCYYVCYEAFRMWGYTSEFSDKVLLKISATGLFDNVYRTKAAIMILLVISLFGVKGKKDEKANPVAALVLVILGMAIFFACHYIF